MLLKKGHKPVIALGNNPGDPHGLVIRIFGDDGSARDYPIECLMELARNAPLFTGSDDGPLNVLDTMP